MMVLSVLVQLLTTPPSVPGVPPPPVVGLPLPPPPVVGLPLPPPPVVLPVSPFVGVACAQPTISAALATKTMRREPCPSEARVVMGGTPFRPRGAIARGPHGEPGPY